MGRPAKPIQLHQANGNIRHLTKTEIEQREKQEAKLRSGQKSYKASPQVRTNPVSKAMFNKLKRLYAEIEFVEALDENVINRYCLLHAEYARLSDLREELLNRMESADDLTSETRLKTTDRVLEIDRRMEKKLDMLLKLEDRLFLNPTARIKNVPRKPEEKTEATPAERMFGRV